MISSLNVVLFLGTTACVAPMEGMAFESAINFLPDPHPTVGKLSTGENRKFIAVCLHPLG